MENYSAAKRNGVVMHDQHESALNSPAKEASHRGLSAVGTCVGDVLNGKSREIGGCQGQRPGAWGVIGDGYGASCGVANIVELGMMAAQLGKCADKRWAVPWERGYPV